MFRNRIVFKSENPEQPGFYVMNPDGSNREYLGTLEYYDGLFEALRETERFSPDKQYSVSTEKVDGRAQVVMHLPFDKRWGQLPPQPVTRLTGIAYDPVWSPDGSTIAFTAAENESDDIWVIRPDSSGQKSLMRNDWEWDKHASYSPDSQRIAFFSNRFGERQILIMDTNGQNIVNISNTPWAEYDPIWVK
jgi:TolB protein